MRFRMDSLPRPARQVGLHGRRRARAGGAGRRPRARTGHRPRPRRRVQRAAHQGALGLELVGRAAGARLPLPGRRRGDRRPQQPVRGALRRARAGAAPRGARAPTPTAEEAGRELVRRAARSHGVGTAGCLRRLLPDAHHPREERRALGPGGDRRLVEAGELEQVRSRAGRRPAYLHLDARRPRAVRARTLLSPFDPVVWGRDRTETLFDFLYRIEIYVPAPQRQYGYYVLPFLLGDRIVARVDLKADRPAAGCSCRARTPRRARRRRRPPSWRPSCGGWPAGSASPTSSCRRPRRPGAGPLGVELV